MTARIFFIIAAILVAAGAKAQYVYQFRIINEKNIPLQGATISKNNLLAISGKTGLLIINSESVTDSFFISHTGYESVMLYAKSDSLYTVVLSSKIILLEEAVVHAYESNTTAYNVPAAVTKITADDLNRFRSSDFTTAMNTVPGVKMDERSPGSYRISIRGNLQRSTFGVRNIKVYWNGIPFTDASGNTYINQVAPSLISGIEVLRGPSASMYGAGTSGVLLLSSSQFKNGVSGEAIAGSYGLFNITGSYQYNNKNDAGRLTYAHTQSEGYRNHTEIRRDVIHYANEFRIDENKKLRTNILYSDLYYQTPGALTAAEVESNPRQSRPAAGIFKSAEEQQAALYLKTFYASVAGEWKRNKFSNTTGVYTTHTQFKNPTIRNYERKTEQGYGARTIFRFDGNKINFSGGAEYQYAFNNTGTYANRSGIADTLQYQDEIGSRQYNIFLQGSFSISRLLISAGVSYNNYHYNFLRVSLPGSNNRSSDFSPQFIPRLALLYNVTDHLNVFASIGKGYSPPSIDEVHASDGNFNTSLRAEQSISTEAGIKTKLFNNKLNAEINYYQYQLKNTIVSRRDSSGADYYVNSGKMKQNGVEASVSYHVFKSEKCFITALNIHSSASFIHARYKDYTQGNVKYDGNKVTGTPPHVIVISTDLQMKHGVFLNAVYCYTDAIPLNDANTFYGNHYNQIFIKAGVKLKTVLHPVLFFTYEKSFNNPYSLGNDLNAAGGRYYNPSAPEMFTAGLKIVF